MLKSFYNQYRSEINRALFLVLFIILSIVMFKYLMKYIAPFILGYVISLLLIPIANLLSKASVRFLGKKIYIARGLSSFISLIFFIFALGLLSTTIVTNLIKQGREYAAFFPELLEQSRITIESVVERYQHYIGFVPNELQVFFEEQLQAFSGILTDLVGSGVKQGSVNLVVSIPNLVITTILSLISAFFFTKDTDLIKNQISKMLPTWIYHNMSIVRSGLSRALLGYVKAQCTLASINACICVIGLSIMRYPYALFVGLGISLVDVLPVFGAGAVLWPWAAFSLITGNIQRAIGLMIIYATILITRQILEPKVLGDNIGVYPLVTLMAMYIGLKMLGFLGLIAGPVLVIICKSIWETPLENRPTEIGKD